MEIDTKFHERKDLKMSNLSYQNLNKRGSVSDFNTYKAKVSKENERSHQKITSFSRFRTSNYTIFYWKWNNTLINTYSTRSSLEEAKLNNTWDPNLNISRNGYLEAVLVWFAGIFVSFDRNLAITCQTYKKKSNRNN